MTFCIYILHAFTIFILPHTTLVPRPEFKLDWVFEVSVLSMLSTLTCRSIFWYLLGLSVSAECSGSSLRELRLPHHNNIILCVLALPWCWGEDVLVNSGVNALATHLHKTCTIRSVHRFRIPNCSWVVLWITEEFTRTYTKSYTLHTYIGLRYATFDGHINAMFCDEVRWFFWW